MTCTKKKWRHFASRDPRAIRIYFFKLLNIYIFFFFHHWVSHFLSAPVFHSLCSFALWIKYFGQCSTSPSRSSLWRGHGRMKFGVISFQLLQSDVLFRFFFLSFFLSLNGQHEKRLSAGHETGLGPRLSSGFISSDSMTGRGGRHHRRRSFLMQQSN